MKIPYTTEIRKNIVIMEWWSSAKTGIEILYEYNGKEMLLTCTQEQSAELLKKCSMIHNYTGSNDSVAIEVEYTIDGVGNGGDHVQKSYYKQMPYEDFAQSFKFSQYDALMIATEHEFGKAIQKGFDDAFESARAMHYATHHSHTDNNFLN